MQITGKNLTTKSFADVVFRHEPVRLAPSARRAMLRSNATVQRLVEHDEPVYGVNTGVGKLSDQRIPHDEIRQLQLNLIRSHACGVGDPLDEADTRAVMLLRANVLAAGYSGVRPVIVETLLAMLNKNILPVIPCRGSVGASGDLAPLAHLALVLVGEGKTHDGRRPKAIQLEAKEGISLVNGTQVMCALGLLALLRCENLADTADVAGALSLDGLRGTPVAFDSRIHVLRPFDGQRRVATNLRRLMAGSEIRESHRDAKTDPRIQDQYSLRCMPQVHGAVRDALDHVARVTLVEMNAATDNPMVFAESGEILSGGNFHGQPVAIAADFLAIAAAELGSISERRTERLVNPALSGLPAFLAREGGLHSGLMMAHVTAAALASESKTLAHPASVDSIPTSAGKEDHVSMGPTAAWKAARVVENASRVLAIELLAACEALDFRRPLRSSAPLEAVHALVRTRVPAHGHDRPLSPEIEALAELVASGAVARAAEAACGALE